MLVPLKWLREFVDHRLSPDELARVLTMAGLEADGVEERSARLHVERMLRRGEASEVEPGRYQRV